MSETISVVLMALVLSFIATPVPGLACRQARSRRSAEV